MTYQYSGYLSTIFDKPDPALLDSTDSITFGGDDLAAWRTKDVAHSREWNEVPVRKIQTAEGIRLEGDFTGVLSIDSLSTNDPRYWAPLSTFGLTDARFPVDVSRYPVIEVTYRCTSEHAHPTWMWTYDGGSHFGALPKTREWMTVARNVQHFGFPSRVDNVVLRLYSPTRSLESFEIKSVRFRAMSPEEIEATRESLGALEGLRPPRRFPVLDEFMPLGVYMDADAADRLADMLGVSPGEYWDLAIEDLVVHGHNAIALAHFDRIEPREREALLARCEEHGIKIVARHEYPVGGDSQEQDRVLDEHIRSTATSPALLARTFAGEPIENNFLQVIEAKQKMEEADPDHPVAIIARYPNAYPLFAPYFAASGVGYFGSKQPWEAGRTVRVHVPLGDAQQFWFAAPAFMYPTQTPSWSTCPEMRLMTNLAFANGARGWFAYSYHNDPVWLRGRLQRSLTGPFLAFSDLWSELMLRMKWAGSLAPLLLAARAEDEMDDWFVRGVSSSSSVRPAPGVPPISQFHLRGEDFSLYFTVSNNTREIASVEIDIPEDAVAGEQLHDLSEFVTMKEWRLLNRHRHLEMFPGQAHIILVASPSRSEEIRQQITREMIAIEQRKLRYSMEIAHVYDMDIGDVEKSLDRLSANADPADLVTVLAAKDRITDLLYETAAIRDARSYLIEASAAVCGCDGALCRLMALGKGEQARDLGSEVIPLAAEFTQQRLDLRRGNGGSIVESARENAARSRALLEKIRGYYD